MQPKRLYRSTANKVFGGVCGGVAEYFDIDPVIVRVIFVLLAIFGGSGGLLYIASWIIIPKKPIYAYGAGVETEEPVQQKKESGSARKIFGIILIVIGGIIFLDNINIFSFFDIWDVSMKYVFPILLIIFGMAIIYYRQVQSPAPGQQPAGGENPETPPPSVEPSIKSFRRSAADRKIFGVCGGLAQYFSLDSTIIRILYVFLCLASFGSGIILYLLLALVVPEERPQIVQ